MKGCVINKMINWTKDMDNDRIQMKKEGCSCKQIAETLSEKYNIYLNKKAIFNRNYICKKINKHHNVKIDNKSNMFSDIETSNINNSLFKNINMENISERIQGIETIKQVNYLHDYFLDKNINKIVSLSDLHIPYVDLNALNESIKNNMDADMILLNGDILDCESLSSFNNTNENNINSEIYIFKQILQILSNNFKYICILNGNHENRLRNYVSHNININNRDYAKQHLDPIKNAINDFDNVFYCNSSYLEIGDALFSHPSHYSSVDLKTVVNEFTIKQANKYDLPNPDFKLLSIGHSHMMGDVIIGNNQSTYNNNVIKLMEQGCLCIRPQYKFDKPTKRAWVLGYAVVYLNNNKVDINLSHNVIL